MLKSGRFAVDLKIPRFFDGIPVVYDGENEPKELEIFEIAMALVARLIDSSSTSLNILLPNIYFLETDSPEFTLSDDMLGCFHQAIIFPVTKWRTLDLSDFKILFVMVEELCHAIWQIPDGPPIEAKVTKVFQQLCPDFSYLEVASRLS